MPSCRSAALLELDSGVKLHYRTQGKVGAPWIVLLNGLLSDSTLWAGVLPGLTPSFRVLTLDGRGQGRSDAPSDGPYTPEQSARDAWELIQKLGILKPWLVGLSNGASISLELLAAHPGAFAGGVLTSCAPRIDFTMRLKLLHWIQCLELGGPLLQFDAAAPFLWGDRFLEQRHAILRAYHHVVTQGRGHASKACPESGDPHLGARLQLLGVLDWDIRARLKRIIDPVLLLSGAEDLLTPPWKCLETAQGIPGSQFQILPGIGHAFPVEDPKAFCEQVLTFFTLRQGQPINVAEPSTLGHN